jgi:tetratricopeptide (TPR) repeat protein
MTATRLLIGVVLAVGVPAAALHLSAAERHPHGLTAAPFATPRLLVAQLVMALPLGLMLAVWLSHRAREAGGLATRLVLVGPAAFVGVLACSGVGSLLADAGFTAHAVARSLLAVALATPWLFVVQGRAESAGLRGWHWAVGGLLALFPPAMYADRLRESETRVFTEYRDTGRFVRARALLDGLADLGADLPSFATRAEARKQLDRDIATLTEAVRAPLTSNAPPSVRLVRGFVLIQLDRLGEAEAILTPLTEGDPNAALVLAAAYRDQQRWDEAEALSRRAIESLNPQDQDLLTTAYDGWAEAARGAGRPADAERALREALDRLPGRAAYYHLKLGRHYHDGGRPAAALDHLGEAIRLDPSGAGKEAQDVSAQIRRMTPACVLK